MNDLNRAEAHLQKAAEDLREARSLLDAGFPDGTCNRAYYALFHAIIALLYTTDGPIPKTHTGAHTEFRRQFIRPGLFADSFSNTITLLFNLRQGSDYEIEFDTTLDDAQDAVNKAAEFLSKAEAYMKTIQPR
ncbi:HEPN domain-containing protein [Spirosoma rhododendri]|uniref:HEPN domain-containing protein n=1 Tax=Spirosoma rhododendri TaxID=2728024 RepID=A0A7L5DSN2_9BACT|nr:HEPN domain-containing protein [Spirosoma rhododendri]QJD80273.1 HEPN domain-containing protein [Spirosoma rhododendri]